MARTTPSVVLAVKRDLRELERRSPGISKSGLAAGALAMARELDDPENTASGKASCMRQLDAVLAELRLTARRAQPHDPKPNVPTETPDGLDEITARRAARRAGP